MNNDLSGYQRKSFMQAGEIYFWTATINSWYKLLLEDGYKDILIDSLRYLSNAGTIDVFAFVIMPNHIHLIWRINGLNGKETPQGSFLKFTAHEFKKMLKAGSPEQLAAYKIDAVNKSYEFWQRDPLAIRLYSKPVAIQKLKYIHYNPLAEHWQLVKDPCDYVYSSAEYYETGQQTKFDFLKDLWLEF
jgi:REP element-mobilizing transposase RayT